MLLFCLFPFRVVTDGGESKGCDVDEGKCSIEPGASESEVDITLRAFFDTRRNRPTSTPRVGIHVDAELMAETENTMEKGGCRNVIKV